MVALIISKHPGLAPFEVKTILPEAKVHTAHGHGAHGSDGGAIMIQGKTVFITGGRGFIASHLCEFLLEQGCEVVGMDNFITGSRSNIAHLEAMGQAGKMLVAGPLAEGRRQVRPGEGPWPRRR